MDQKLQNRLAARFLRLHRGPQILILPNAWDAASARIFEAAGFAAIATTSAGVAWSLGYPDGEAIGSGEMAEAIGRIVRAVALPVNADIEAGYGPTAKDVSHTVRSVVEAGVAGVNLEDRAYGSPMPLREMDEQIDRLEAAREAAHSAGARLVLNARTDVFLAHVGAERERLAHAIRRANAYREAGADCLFVPGVHDRKTIAVLAREIAGPLNIMAAPGCPSAPELQRLGVARVSVGGGPMRASMTLIGRLAADLKNRGRFTLFAGRSVITHQEANRLMAPRARRPSR